MSGLWDAIQAQAAERLEIEVPEWKDLGHGVVWSQACTIEDEAKIRRAVKGGEDDPTTWARLVWMKAQSESGARLFEGVDFSLFKRQIPAALCRRIGMQIYLGSTTTVEDAEGNS